MNRDKATNVAILFEKITKLEKDIFELQDIMNKDSYEILAYDKKTPDQITNFNKITLKSNEISTVVFTQDILQLYIDTLNLELNELTKELDEL